MDPVELIQEGKVKRYFRAERKLNVPGMVFHITQRAAGKEPLFLERSDYLAMIWLFKELAKSHGLEFYAFCLMPNHVHLLCSLQTANLYDAMRDLFARYAMRFNKKYERRGHLFGGPYRQAVCLDEAYVVAASLYIHLNPVKAGLVEDPTRYRWSSSRLYTGRIGRKSFVDPKFVLGLLSSDPLEARERYNTLLLRGGDVEMRPASEDRKAVAGFLSGLANRVPALWSWFKQRSPGSERKAAVLHDSEYWEEKILALRREGLGRKPETKAAMRHAIEQLLARGYKREEIAARLEVSRKTLYNLLRH